MRDRIRIAAFISVGTILIALAIALYGSAFSRAALVHAAQTSSIAMDARMAKAACVPDTASEKNDIFFISCGGIY